MLNPTQQTNRWISLDILRGIAVFGILVMNISSFGNVYAYYLNPFALGEISQVDFVTWLVTHFVADQRFYTIFSILFGAGVMLMAQRASSRGVAPGPVHYKRMGWLLLFGLLHGYLIWFGDILATYAITGMWVYLFALKTQAKTKYWVGSILLILYALIMFASHYMAVEFDSPEAAKMTESITPSLTEIERETGIYKGTWLEQFYHRLEFYSMSLATMIFFLGPLKVGGSMLLGMGLYQSGILTAKRSRVFYIKWSLVMLLIAVAFCIWDYWVLAKADFNNESIFLSFSVINSSSAVFVALFYIGLICLWSKASSSGWFRRKFTAVGKMAFTNYIMQSVICTVFFYGFGFGFYGELDRYQLYYVVGAIFMLQMVASELWLKYFYYGPLEWLWRSLTYGKAQPFSRAHS